MYVCEYCSRSFTKPVSSGHKRKCTGFLAANPPAKTKPRPCLCGHESTSLTQMKRHRVSCPDWASRDKNGVALDRIRETYKLRYGPNVSNSMHVPAFAKKKAATMLNRYGSENPFSKDSSLYEMVQSYWDGKDRTAHLDKNNWARPEVKQKIRDYWQRNYGVNNGSQVPEIRAKQLSTMLERYGDEQGLRVPSIRQKGIETLIEKYGVTNPMLSREIIEKVRLTNLSIYGVEWTTVHPETRQKQYETQFAKYGTFFFGSSIGKKIVAETSVLVQQKIAETCLLRYGVSHPMKDPDYARKHLEHSRRAGPNSLEYLFQYTFPDFKFTGDGSYWRFLPLLNRNKNPDFVLPGSSDGSFRDSKIVVEIFGDYWHSESKTGSSCIDHEIEMINAWNDVGMSCLVLWESEMKLNDDWKLRVKKFTEEHDGNKVIDIPIGSNRRFPTINSVPSELVDFDFLDVSFTRSDVSSVRGLFDAHHYAGFGRPAKAVYAAFVGGSIIAAVKIASPVRQGIAGTFGLSHGEVLELDRMCIDPKFQKKNVGSFLLSRVIRSVRSDFPNVKKLVSFADPRFGHSGTVYKAANWKYVGQTAKSYIYIGQDGAEVNKKTLYDWAKRHNKKESEAALELRLSKVYTPRKFKFVYDLLRSGNFMALNVFLS